LGLLEVGRKLPDQCPDHHQGQPEEQTLESRIQVIPSLAAGVPSGATGCAFKITTHAWGAVTRHSSAIVSPTTHTIRPAASTTIGTRSRRWRGILRSTSTSCSLRWPGAPSG